MSEKKLVIDIRKPQNKAQSPDPVIIVGEKIFAPKIIETKSPPKLNYKKTISALALTVALLLGTFYTVGFFELKNTVTEAAPLIYTQFKEVGSALNNLETGKAKSSIASADALIKKVKAKAESYGLIKISEIWSSAIPQLKYIPETIKGLGMLSESTFNFALALEELKENGFKWLTSEKGPSLIANLESLNSNLNKIISVSSTLKNAGSKLNYLETEEFLSQTLILQKNQKFLSSILNWLKEPQEKHYLILFQNSSELRPSGGFLGSYADLTINQNGLKEIKVWDIYDPDGQLDLNIVPPKQLQTLTERWGARDANWFFDFPTSAKKIISFLELSKIYREKLITFDGASAINIEVIKTLLSITGPIELPEYRLKITSDNFLPLIQREVEAGEDKAKGEPKRILKKLAPIMLQKLGNLNQEEKVYLLNSLKSHIENKDIMIYFKNPDIENHLQELGAGGEVAEISKNFNGEYLAIVNANIAGGKSDAFIKQKIRLASKIDSDGRIDNYLILEKKHSGNTAKDSWYKAPNKSYIKIFTPYGSRLVFADGNSEKIIKAPLNYAALGYIKDQDLEALESTFKTLSAFGVDEMKESEKTVFGAWFNVNSGSEKKLELEYFNPKRLALGKDNLNYEFIFEKQSGSNSSLDFLIEAPKGYKWLETDSNFFNYVSDNLPARLSIKLTLALNPEANQR